jgi:hypothetical protein
MAATRIADAGASGTTATGFSWLVSAIAGRSLLGAGLRGSDIFEGKQRFGREQDRKQG